jgi:hypothetical protein
MTDTPQNGRIPQKPQDWDKVVSAAYLRVLGQTQSQVAEVVGCDRATLSRWEHAEFWPVAVAEACDRWIDDKLIGKAMSGLEAAVMAEGGLAMTVLERLVPRLAPLASKLNIKQDVNVNHVNDAAADFTSRIRSLAARN